MTRKQFGKLLFHKDTVALIASLIFLWLAISLITDSNLTVKDLRPHPGTITNIDSVIIKVIDKQFFKQITKELQIMINNEEGSYTSISTEHFGDIISQIAVGDSIIIYTKPKVWRVFGLKNKMDISHMTKESLIVIAYENYKKSIFDLYLLPLLASIVGFIFYLDRVTRRYSFDIKRDP